MLINGKNFAAIDLGTNSCRLMITDKTGKCLYRNSIPTKLGEGMYAHMRFTPEAIERGLKAFREYSGLMKEYDVGVCRAIATASCRMAENGADFVQEVRKRSGVELEIIDGREEARLNLKGALLNAPKTAKYAVVYDLGGGSTEISLATNDKFPKILYTVSIPWGGRNAAEAFGLTDYDRSCRENLAKEIKTYVSDFVVKSGLDNYRSSCCLLATSSTPLRLIALAENWNVYDRFKADGRTISRVKLDEAVKRVYAMDAKERLESPYIGENRAPIFVAACTIFKTIYDGLGFDELTASLKSAQDGIIKELIDNGKTDTFCQNGTRQKNFNGPGQNR